MTFTNVDVVELALAHHGNSLAQAKPDQHSPKYRLLRQPSQGDNRVLYTIYLILNLKEVAGYLGGFGRRDQRTRRSEPADNITIHSFWRLGSDSRT